MMQFSMYHHYTVDEHLIRAIGVLSALRTGQIAGDHPLSRDILPSIKDIKVLTVALFLHDIAKGRPEDHSLAGAKVARRLCPRLGLSARETELVAWLVEEHLTMSRIAQSRDLADRRTIVDFAGIVQSMERLKLLLVLTVCDIRAVGPGVWNGWKGQLLRTLYLRGRASPYRRFQHRFPQRKAGGGARPPRGNGSPTGRRRSASATSTCTTPPIGCASTRKGRCAMPPSCAMPTGAAQASPARSGRWRSRAPRKSPSSPPTIRGFCPSSPELARRATPTSSTRRFSRPRTDARSTRSS